jgi:hypothetical protein
MSGIKGIIDSMQNSAVSVAKLGYNYTSYIAGKSADGAVALGKVVGTTSVKAAEIGLAGLKALGHYAAIGANLAVAWTKIGFYLAKDWTIILAAALKDLAISTAGAAKAGALITAKATSLFVTSHPYVVISVGAITVGIALGVVIGKKMESKSKLPEIPEPYAPPEGAPAGSLVK